MADEVQDLLTELEAAVPDGGTEQPAVPETPAEVPPWQAEIEKLRADQESKTAQTMAVLSEMASLIRQNQAAKPAPTAEQPKPAPVDRGELWKAAVQSPEYIPQLIEEETRRAIREELSGFRQSLEGDWGRTRSVERLQEMIHHNYKDEIADTGSEILKATPEMRELVRPLIREDLVNTPAHDRLAFLVAAAGKPAEVTKRFSAITAANEAKRQGQIERLTKLGVLGGSRTPSTEPPKITAEDEATFERFGWDPKDEKIRERFLKAKSTERLQGITAWGSIGPEGT